MDRKLVKLDIPLNWFLTVLIIMLIGMVIDFALFSVNLITTRVMTLFVFILGIDSVFVVLILSWAKYKGVPVRKREKK
ncbi:MAG: hypothetical protein H3Z53_09730 [archaeon]|nr:hypothetical protein [archaeon]MCP8314630.1 hypothetical protein [archaeon]